MDISRPCQPEKLIPLLPWPGFDPSFSGHNDRRAIISEWTWLRLIPEGKQKTYKSNGQKQKYILTLTLTRVSIKSMCFHTATYRSFLSFCVPDGKQSSIPSGPFWQIEWREYNLLFLEDLPCGWLIDWLWMPGSPGRTHLTIRRCATCVVSYSYTSTPPPPPPTPDLRGEQYWYMGKFPRVVTALVGSFTSTLSVRVEGQ